MMNLLTEVDPKTGRKTLSPIYGILRSRRKAEIHKDEPEQKSVETRREVVTALKPRPAPVITAEQKKSMDDLAKLKSGIPFTRSYPQTEIREPEPQKPTMSFEEEILHSWQNDSALQKEFASFNSYASFMKAQREGRAKIHRGSVAR